MLYRAKIVGKDKLAVEKVLWSRYRKSVKEGMVFKLTKNILAILFWVVLVYLIVNVKDNLKLYGGMASYVAILISILFAITHMHRLSHKRLTEVFFDSDNIEFEFGDDGVAVRGATGIESRLKYEDIQNIEEISNMLVFWVTPKGGLHMPVSVFANGNEKEEFIKFVNSKRG